MLLHLKKFSIHMGNYLL